MEAGNFQRVDGDGGGRVVDMDSLLGAMAIGAMGFLNARGPSVPALDLLGARILDLCQCP